MQITLRLLVCILMIHRRRAWSIYCLITAVQQRNDVKRMLHGHSSHARDVDLHLLSSSMEGATKPGTAALTPYSVGRWYTAWLVTVSGRHQQCLDGDSITAGAEHVQLWRWSPETVQPRKGQRLGPWERLVQRWDYHSSYALRVGKSVLNSQPTLDTMRPSESRKLGYSADPSQIYSLGGDPTFVITVHPSLAIKPWLEPWPLGYNIYSHGLSEEPSWDGIVPLGRSWRDGRGLVLCCLDSWDTLIGDRRELLQ